MIDTEFSDSVLTLTLVGTVTEDDIAALRETIEAAFSEHSEISMVLDLTRWEDVTGNAIREDMALELKLLGKLGRIERIAFLSDKQWVTAMARGVGPWLPSVSLRAFPGDQGAAAREWARG